MPMISSTIVAGELEVGPECITLIIVTHSPIMMDDVKKTRDARLRSIAEPVSGFSKPPIFILGSATAISHFVHDAREFHRAVDTASRAMSLIFNRFPVLIASEALCPECLGVSVSIYSA